MAEPDIAAEGERKRRDGSERGNENMTAGERSKWALIVEGTTLHCGRKSRNEECWSSIASVLKPDRCWLSFLPLAANNNPFEPPCEKKLDARRLSVNSNQLRKRKRERNTCQII